MSTELRTTTRADIPALRALWRQAFGDTDAELDLFFSEAWAPDGMFCLTDSGALAAMAAWFPTTVCVGARGWPAAYLYAVATDEKSRGRGFCRELLEHMAAVLPDRGVRCLTLAPGSEELFGFYEKLGFVTGFTRQVLTLDSLPPVTGEAEAVEPPAYLMAREAFLEGGTFLSYPVPVLSYQQKAARQEGGDLFLLETAAASGCACAVVRDGCALIHELLWPGDPAEGAALVCGALGVQRCQVRLPGNETPCGMVRFLGDGPQLEHGHLGLALD